MTQNMSTQKLDGPWKWAFPKGKESSKLPTTIFQWVLGNFPVHDIRFFSWTLHKPIPSMYGIFTYMYHKNQPNVGKYTSPMDGMGNDSVESKRSQDSTTARWWWSIVEISNFVRHDTYSEDVKEIKECHGNGVVKKRKLLFFGKKSCVFI